MCILLYKILQSFNWMEFSNMGRIEQGSQEYGHWNFLEKIITYPNEANHDDCAVAFTGGYVSADIQQNFSYMEEMWLGSRKYGHSYFWKKIVVVQMKQFLKNNLRPDANIILSAIFVCLSKPIGAAFFSIAYIQHTSVLWCSHVIFETHLFWQFRIVQ